MDMLSLRDIIVTYFSDSELRDLCFDLGIDYESLPGEGKAAKARELVSYCQRHGRLAELEAACRRLRPSAFKDSHTASAESAPNAPKTDGQPAGAAVNQSGGVTINAQTVNITGDVIGRDKKSSSGSDSDQSSKPA
jgi:hypothetical protein